MLFTSVPRLVMDKFSGREEVGYFVAMSSFDHSPELLVDIVVDISESTGGSRVAVIVAPTAKRLVQLCWKAGLKTDPPYKNY